MSHFEFFVRLDKIISLLINHDSSYRYMDPVMLLARNPLTWIPLYLFIAWYMFLKMGKKGWQFVLFSLINLAITDSISVLLKNSFHRLRPCFDQEISGLVRHLVDCGGAYSFPSSHAANHFGLAFFWFWSIYKVTGKKWKWLWIWASVICYAQIYVGKHFLSDVVAGRLLGMTVGIIMAKFFEFVWNSGFDWQQILFSIKRGNIHPVPKSTYTIE